MRRLYRNTEAVFKVVLLVEKIIIPKKDFRLSDTFECGQCFRWEKSGESYTGVAGGRAARLTEDDEAILIECGDGEFKAYWERYFDLKRDYGKIKSAVSIDEFMKNAVTFGGGIRILKQDFFETLMSFIISQRSSIPRIKSVVGALSKKYGKKIHGSLFSFPSPERLAALTEDDFRALGTGYRAPYLLKAAQGVASGEISEKELSSLSTPQARERLLSLSGVGDKVCDCVMLFSLARFDLFPTDVWIKRVMAEHYASSDKTAKSDGERMFGEYSGFAQQYLFYYRRSL